MKNGDHVRVRLAGSTEWGHGEVIMVSANGNSLMLHGDELPSMPRGMTVHPEFGKVLLLAKQGDFYAELVTGHLFEVEE